MSVPTLPAAEDLPDNLGLRMRESGDLLLVRPIGRERLSVEGVTTDAAALLIRGAGKDFYVAVAGTHAGLPDGIGFHASTPVLFTARGERGAVFCDRPHKQPEPMVPVELIVKDARIMPGRRVFMNGRRAGVTKSGGFALLLQEPGQHNWEVR